MMKFLKNNGKLLAVVLAVVFVFGVGRQLIISLFGDDRTVTPLDDSGSTLGEGIADTLAGELFRAMHGQIGTNEDMLSDIFYHMKNMGDYAAVYNRFGLRYYDPLFGREGFPVIHPKLNLTEWLNRDLGDEDKANLREQYPHITIWT